MRSSGFLASLRCLSLATPLMLLAPTIAAQEAPPHLASINGVVTIEREGESSDAGTGQPVVAGDRLRTESGLAEIWFPDGSALDLDAYTTVDLLDHSLLRLIEGRVILRLARGLHTASRPEAYQIDTPWGSAVATVPGDYRLAAAPASTAGSIELAVFRGLAELRSDGGAVTVHAGERAHARGEGAPSVPEPFDTARLDTFERWSAGRRDERLSRASSTRYLPDNLRMYGGTFDRYGSWDYDAANGYVWYPTVDPGWRPYYNGYWSSVRSYGWTWIGLDVWGWPTHHYGRWGLSRSRWYWIPERHWAPAWVSWAAATDYVSWCPIGLDNRPLFNLSISAGNHWAGWVILPRSSFGGRHSYVNRYAVDGRRLPGNTPFVARSQAPVLPAFRGREGLSYSRSGGVALPRYPVGSAGGTAPGARPTPYGTARGESAPGRIAPGARDAGPADRRAVAADRAGYARGDERRPASPNNPTGALRPNTPRSMAPTERALGGPGMAVPRTGESLGSRRGIGGGTPPATAPRSAPPARADRTGNRRAELPPAGYPVTPRGPRAAPGVDRDPGGRQPLQVQPDDLGNRRYGVASSGRSSQPPPPPRANDQPRPGPRERSAPSRDAASTRAQPRADRAPDASRDRGAAASGSPRGQDGGGTGGSGRSGGQGRRGR